MQISYSWKNSLNYTLKLQNIENRTENLKSKSVEKLPKWLSICWTVCNFRLYQGYANKVIWIFMSFGSSKSYNTIYHANSCTDSKSQAISHEEPGDCCVASVWWEFNNLHTLCINYTHWMTT